MFFLRIIRTPIIFLTLVTGIIHGSERTYYFGENLFGHRPVQATKPKKRKPNTRMIAVPFYTCSLCTLVMTDFQHIMKHFAQKHAPKNRHCRSCNQVLPIDKDQQLLHILHFHTKHAPLKGRIPVSEYNKNLKH